jgi:hypothetical protein
MEETGENLQERFVNGYNEASLAVIAFRSFQAWAGEDEKRLKRRLTAWWSDQDGSLTSVLALARTEVRNHLWTEERLSWRSR